MKESIRLSEVSDVMLEVLASGGEVRFTSNGISMQPLLQNGAQQVVLKKPEGRLKRNDIAFYRRDNGQFVLHRVVWVKKDSYIMCGDNQPCYEYGVTDENILAKMIAFIRGGKRKELKGIGYRLYLCYVPIRRMGRKLKMKVGRLCGK